MNLANEKWKRKNNAISFKHGVTNEEMEFAEISASEDEGDEDRKHQKLLEALEKLKGKKARVFQRSEPSTSISEFNLTEVGKERVKLQDLIKTLKQTSGHVAIKQQLRDASKRKKILPVPLAKPEAEKIKRGIAYDKVSKEVGKWDTVVRSNRLADQIIYPLKQPEFRLETTEDIAKRFKTKTPLEKEISMLLNSSENMLNQEKELTAAEEKALQAMSVEEAKERHSELQKMRALLSYQEAKARRQKKIKSKKYHRILKKEKMRYLMKEFEELQKTNPEAANEKLNELDKQRILERMTLKHRNTGKWAKHQKLRAKYNPVSRDNLKEQFDLSHRLTEKVSVPEDKSDESDSSVKNDTVRNAIRKDDDTLSTSLLDLYNPWVKSALNNNKHNAVPAAQHIKNKRNVTNIDPPKHLETSIDNQKTNYTDNMDCNNEEQLDENLERRKTLEDFEELSGDTSVMQGKEAILSKPLEVSNTDTNIVKTKNNAKTLLDPTKFVVVETKVLHSMAPDSISTGNEGIDDITDQHMTIAEAFADDDVIREFKEAKKAVVEEDKPKGINLFLPGWGTWDGAGIKISKRKKRRFFVKPIDAPPRKDDTLGNVIINEDKDKKASVHQVSEVPFPFRSVQQFESSIRQPIGNTWNPETAFQKLVAPKVITKLGKIIEPIDADALLLHKKPDKKQAVKG